MLEALNEPPTLVHKYPDGYSDGDGQTFISNNPLSLNDELYADIL